MMTEQKSLDPAAMPDTTVDVSKVFGIETKMKVPAFKTANEYVPDHDAASRFFCSVIMMVGPAQVSRCGE